MNPIHIKGTLSIYPATKSGDYDSHQNGTIILDISEGGPTLTINEKFYDNKDVAKALEKVMDAAFRLHRWK